MAVIDDVVEEVAEKLIEECLKNKRYGIQLIVEECLEEEPMEVIIQECLQNQSGTLSLPNNNLRQLPKSIGQLTNLTALDLSSNSLGQLPESIGQLTALKSLNLSGSKLKQLPKTIGWLTDLTSLNLSGNNLNQLPETIGQLTALMSLNLSGNNLNKLPETIGQLTALTTLKLGYNGFEENPLSVIADKLFEIGDELDYSLDYYVPSLVLQRIGSHNFYNLIFKSSYIGLQNLYKALLREQQHFPEFIGLLTTVAILQLCGKILMQQPSDLRDSEFCSSPSIPVPAYRGLQRLPESIGNLPALITLNLQCTNLQQLPESIGKLMALTKLNLRSNSLHELPESIGQLTALTKLNLQSNKLQQLPESIGQLTALTSLNLQSNRLRKLPESFDQLTALMILKLQSNNLQQIPESIGQLTALTTLNLGGNNLNQLPESIGQLTALTSLNLGGNNLNQLPESIAQLTALTSLNLNGNNLNQLPETIINLPSNCELMCSDNSPLTQPPQTICEQGFPAIKAYFKDLLDGKSKCLPTVAFMGSHKSGKTSLIRSMQTKSRYLTEHYEESVKVFTLENVYLASDIFIRALDFGGHPIYRDVYKINVRYNCIPIFVLNLAKYKELCEDKTPEEAANELLFSWISPLYLLNPLLSHPILVLTHCDQLPAEKQIYRNLLLDSIEKLKDQLRKDEDKFFRQLADLRNFNVRRHTKIKVFAERTKLIASEMVYMFDKHNISAIEDFMTKLNERVKTSTQDLPKSWSSVVKRILEHESSTLLHYDEVSREINDEANIKYILTYMHNAGLILWLHNKKGFEHIIFHRLDVVSTFLECIFDRARTNKQTWMSLFQNSDVGISEGDYEFKVDTLLESGRLSNKLLQTLFQLLNCEIPYETGKALLQSFHLMSRSIITETNDEEFVVPFYCSTLMDKHTNDKDLKLCVRIEYSGLPIPDTLYHQITVLLLSNFCQPTDTRRAHKNGAVVYRDEIFIAMSYSFQASIVDISISFPLTKVSFAWKYLMEMTRGTLLLSVSEWPGVLYSCYLLCNHLCCQTGGDKRKHEIWWAQLTDEDIDNWKDNERISVPKSPTDPNVTYMQCHCEQNIPVVLVNPPPQDGASPNQMTGLKEYLRVLGDLDLCQALNDDSPTEMVVNVKPTVESLKHRFNMDSNIYKMTSPRGRALIINIEKDRPGSERDVHHLEQLLNQLQFEVTIKIDVESFREVLQDEIEEHSRRDVEYGAFVLVIMSHGDSETLQTATGMHENRDILWRLLEPNNFNKMAGKPIFVIVEACYGDRTDHGMAITQTDGNTETSIGTIPSHQDRLFVYGSYYDTPAYRDPVKGAWFIRCLVDTFASLSCEKDLLELLMIVRKRLANKTFFGDKKQTTFEQTTLTKKFFCFQDLNDSAA